MFNICIVLLLSFTALLSEMWESTIDSLNGLSYLRVAEDLIAAGIESPGQLKLIEELFVLAAVVDPHLRDSAILGLISIEPETEFVHKLISMRSQEEQLLVPTMIKRGVVDSQNPPESTEQLCSTLAKIRRGRVITQKEADSLQPWGYLVTGGYNAFIQRSLGRRRVVPDDEISTTLRVELAILGGATVWSADYATTSGRPVALSVNDDLANLLNVDPTKRVRRNGQWVIK